MQQQQTVKSSVSFKACLMAARPKTLTAAVVPVLVGTALAMGVQGEVSLMLSLYALLSSLCIQVATNLVNDAIDFKKGADTEDRVGPARVSQMGLISPNQVLIGAALFFLAAALLAIPLILQGGAVIFWVMVASILSGYLYTGGPYPLAYVGLGDLFVILFFGLVSTCSIFYIQTGFMMEYPFIAGLQIGMLATVLIAINNLRDMKSDALANKRTLAVRFGKTFARCEIAVMVLAPFALSAFWFMEGLVYIGAVPFLAFPLGVKIIRSVWGNEPGKIYNTFLGCAALLHILFGVLFLLGMGLEGVS